ncbi:MAG: hypothetical protein ACNI27_14950 [Desulfovibrio sp.]
MRRQKSFFALATFLLAMLITSPALAQEFKTFAVLPFEVNGPDKYQYLSKAVQSMLKSRLVWSGHYEPIPKDAAGAAGSEIPNSESTAMDILNRSNADYIVFGTVNILGQDAIVDMQVYGATGREYHKQNDTSLSQLINSLDKQAQEIRAQVFKRPADVNALTRKDNAPKARNTDKDISVPQNQEFLYASSVDEAKISTINTEFRYEGGTDTPGRWRSRSMKFASTTFTIGDISGNGKNEIAIVSNTGLHIYNFADNRLNPIADFKLSHKFTAIRVFLWDVDKDHKNEIIISGSQDDSPLSKVLSFDGSQITVKQDRIRKYLNVLKAPPAYNPTLFSQRAGRRDLFDSRHIEEVYFSNGELKTIRNVKMPPFSNIYNFCYLPEEMDYNIIQLTDYNTMKTFNIKGEELAKTEESYNSSPIQLNIPMMEGAGKATDAIQQFYYPPIRMIPYSFDKGKHYEVLVNKDISIAAQVFKRFRKFSQGEIHSLYYDGVGMNLTWKTRRIKGTVTDFMLADLNNDGNDQLVILVNAFTGAVGSLQQRSLILTYELNLNN